MQLDQTVDCVALSALGAVQAPTRPVRCPQLVVGFLRFGIVINCMFSRRACLRLAEWYFLSPQKAWLSADESSLAAAHSWVAILDLVPRLILYPALRIKFGLEVSRSQPFRTLPVPGIAC